MTETGSKRPAARVRAALDRSRRYEHSHILSRDALAYAQDDSHVEIEALSDDVYSAARERAARLDD